MTPVSVDRVREIRDLDSLIGFLRDQLAWPAPDNLKVEEMAYDYRADELRLDASTADRVKVRQLAPFVQGQPWGIFLVETNTPKVYATHLRKILRALAPRQRQHSPSLKAWNAENLLFICTTPAYDRFTFAHFKGDKAATARLSIFGWDRGDVGIRTLCEYNLPALRWPQAVQLDLTGAAMAESWGDNWVQAFDVQAVTDKFFRDFARVFEETKKALPKTIQSPADRHAFTQRLLNRLLFLCFLQKKRWLRGPDLDRPRTTYLFDLFDDASTRGEEFYSEYLYDLFFNALNRPPTAYDNRERDRLVQKLGSVPFLNGGLFDPTDELDERGKVSISNKALIPILGPDGLLRRYNFTVTESTPLNQEVAVDPEMLGKVFETVVLTSEEAADYRAPNLRKATGSYYTPRIVVNFIVREVLTDFLTARIPGLTKAQVNGLMEMDGAAGLNKEAVRDLQALITPPQAEALRQQLQTLRACDPAIGSGAFALGLLHELVNLHLLCQTVERGGRDPRIVEHNYVFERKKEIIEQNIYGVDLQGKAAEICKLRLWLSMVVDYDTGVDLDVCTRHEFERSIADIPPLPNLNYKIRRGDSLLDLVHGKPFHLVNPGNEPDMLETRDELAKIHHRFFSAQDPAEKRRLRRDALVYRTRLMRLQLERQRASLLTSGKQMSLLEQKESKAAIRQREQELAELDRVLAEVAASQTKLKGLAAKARLTQADDQLLTELEATNEDEEITFSWLFDFPEIVSITRSPAATIKGSMTAIVNAAGGQMEMVVPEQQQGGFDIIVGNPPFVTARNPEKRELYRERWKETAHMKFQLVAPFFQRSFGLLMPEGHLGFIVSNAFAKREFGKPLVEDFFPTVELQKIVDCSGLMFPGHGTPTCIVFGRNRKPAPDSMIRVVATLSGGGDLRTMPENSPLWATIEAHHDQADYRDSRIAVAGRQRTDMARHPWNLDAGTAPTLRLMENQPRKLQDLIEGDVGVCTMTNADDIFLLTDDFARRLSLPALLCPLYHQGEEIRDWSANAEERLLVPYDSKWRIVPSRRLNFAALEYLGPFRNVLENRHSFGSKTFKELGRVWYEFERMNANKYATRQFLAFPMIATHQHFDYLVAPRVFGRHAQVVKLQPQSTAQDHHFLAGQLNSSAVLFWLKEVCFSKREAEDAEAETYFEFAGGKVQQLPIPSLILEPGAPRERLTALSRGCWERGQQLPGLAFKKLFEIPGEAYYKWNSSLSGWVKPADPSGFQNPKGLSGARDSYTAQRERLRREMIALQEEMDWLVYAAYGFLPADHPAVGNVTKPEPLSLGERPFELKRDGKPIPETWSPERRALWQARLDAIESNEHIRRIEQPVYKRRWYRKESDDQEFRRAFEWWLMEKAEWWLENKSNGAPITVENWEAALWKDERVRAAVRAVEPGAALPTTFLKLFKSIVVENTVPDWIPPATPWDQVEKKFKKVKVPARAKKIRGKLNVPRERFRTNARGEYIWAGKTDSE